MVVVVDIGFACGVFYFGGGEGGGDGTVIEGVALVVVIVRVVYR